MFGEHDVDESEVREAVDYYTKEGNKELKKITDDIRTMFIGFGGTCYFHSTHNKQHTTEHNLLFFDNYRLIILYCIILYYIVLYNIVLHCIVLCCVVLYCIVLYSIVLYCII